MKAMLSTRMHRYAVRVSIIVLTVALALGTSSCTITCDPGNWIPPLRGEIRTWRDLDAIRYNPGGHYVLLNNLHANTAGYDELVGNTADGKGWEPIGTYDDRFIGSFDGQGHEIRGLVINRPDEDNVGLFGCLSEGFIKNVGVTNADVTGRGRVGVLVGYNHFGTVGSEGLPFTRYSTYSREGIVRGIEDVGGLVGRNWQGTVSQCESGTTVSHLPGSSGETRWRAGGLVGANYGTVINCRYEGEVTGHSEVGGLVGLNFFPGTIAACGGEYSVIGERLVGGVAGWNAPRARIHGAWFNGDVNGVPFENILTTLNEGVIGHAHSSSDTLPPGSYVGGLVGRNDGEVEECSASGTVTGTFNVGGLAGANVNEGTLEDCSSVGDVIGDSNVGGLVGLNEGMVNDSRSSGSVTGEQAVGRLVGFNSGTVSNSDSDAKATLAGEDVDDLVGDNRGRILHKLTVSSTGGGFVTTPGEGTFTYDAGTVVDLVAETEQGYRFANWTGEADTIDDVNAPSTTITMNGNYSITANFEVAPVPTIKIAIAGPMDYIQGEHMRYGAEIARDEINALPNKVNVAGTPHAIELIIVDTDEIDNPGEAGEKVEHAITVRGAQFVIGGFRTEAVWDMLDAAADNETIMFICGAATASLLGETVVDDYARYKYIFRATPINDVFLVNNCIHKSAMVAFTAEQTLLAMEAAVTTPRVAIFAEELSWADPIVARLQQVIPGLGYELAYTARVSDTASGTTVQTHLEAIEAAQTHVIITVLSGPVGITYGTLTGFLQTPAISVGINIEAQDPGYWDTTDGGSAYHITFNTYAPSIRQSSLTGPFLDAFAAHTSRKFPLYTAGSYDFIWGLKEAIEAVGSVTDTDAIVAWFENPANARDITTGTLGYYPAGLPEPFHQHDIMYGPDWVTGIGVQWVDGDIVGVWPKAEFGALGNAVCLFAPTIDWSGFEHDGTQMFEIPDWMVMAWMGYTD